MTFAPVNRLSSFRVLPASIAAKDMILRHFDVEAAFPYGKCDENIYIYPPDGVNVPNGKAFQLDMCMYGLKQASRVWYQTASKALRKLGLPETDAEACLFERCVNDDSYMLVQTYVDDLATAARKQSVINTFYRDFSCFFVVKDLGPLIWSLGIKVETTQTKVSVMPFNQPTSKALYRVSILILQKCLLFHLPSRDSTPDQVHHLSALRLLTLKQLIALSILSSLPDLTQFFLFSSWPPEVTILVIVTGEQCSDSSALLLELKTLVSKRSTFLSCCIMRC